MRKMNCHFAWSLWLCVFVALALARSASAQPSTVTGVVVNKQGRAIPGLSAYLVDPEGKRAGPETTDNFGRFSIANVRRRRETYYVEIYWGKQLYARKPVVVDRDINLGNIVL